MFKNLTLSEVFSKEAPFENLIPGSGILLIGTSPIGPTMTPIRALDDEQVITTFGIDSELSNAYMEARMSTLTDIYLMKVNGKHAVTNIQNAITLTSLQSVESSNFLQYEILTSEQDRYLTLYNVETGYNTSYYIVGKTISQLVSEINIDAVTMQSPVYATMLIEGSTDILVDEYFSEAQTDGAITQLGKACFASEIIEALKYVEPYPIAQIGILNEAFDSRDDNNFLYVEISEFAKRKTKACSPCLITIGIDGYMADRGITHHIAKSFSKMLKTEYPVSEFVNVIIARPVFTGLHPDYKSNGVAAYCGIIDSSGPYEGTTNKLIPGATTDDLIITTEQRKELADMGFVVTTQKTFGGSEQLRILRGTNLARKFNQVVDPWRAEVARQIPTPMSSVANVRLVQYVIYQLYDVLQAEEMSKISTLRSRITQVLDEEREHIKDYTINITESYQGFTKTYHVNLEITPVGELDNIALSMQTR